MQGFLPQYSHDMVTSMVLWLDNRLSNVGQGYFTATGSLFRQSNPSVQGVVYASPYKSWVYDSCVSGATVPSGFYTTSGQFLTRASGLVFDFINGRVISSANWGGTLSGAYSHKQVNVYYTSPQETDFVLENAYNENLNLSYPMTGFKGRALQAPLVMLTNAREQNDPFALGGLDNTRNTVRAFIVSNTNYLQEGINSLCRDAAHSYIALGTYADAPITSSGDLKGADYSYCTGIRDKYGCGNGLWVENVYAYKLNERPNKNVTFLLSVLEFDVSKIRVLKQQ